MNRKKHHLLIVVADGIELFGETEEVATLPFTNPDFNMCGVDHHAYLPAEKSCFAFEIDCLFFFFFFHSY